MDEMPEIKCNLSAELRARTRYSTSRRVVSSGRAMVVAQSKSPARSSSRPVPVVSYRDISLE